MAQQERTHVRKEQFGTFGFEADRDGSSAFKVMLQAPLSMVLLWAHGWCGLGGISEVSPSQPVRHSRRSGVKANQTMHTHVKSG